MTAHVNLSVYLEFCQSKMFRWEQSEISDVSCISKCTHTGVIMDLFISSER